VISELVELLETHYIESRKQRRYPVAEPGTLCGVSVEVRNIARGGAQLACEPTAFGEIAERLRDLPVPVELLVEPALAFTGAVVYDKEADGVHLIGVKFIEMSAAEQAALDGYICTLI
jgi:hypothetical protein